jgi:HSP20 family protein
MANENPSRDNPSRQQSGERAQTGTTQQGAGTQRGTSPGGGSYGQGGYGQSGQSASGQGTYAQGTSGQGPGAPGQHGRGTGTSTWQGGQQSGALARGGSQSMSPYSGGYSGYGSGPFSVMRRISDEMDRLFENFGFGRSLFPSESGQGSWDAGGFGESAPSMWSPHVEVCERNGKLLIQADLPGMKRDDVNVRIEQDQVVIQGERHRQQENQQSGYYRSERSYGSFYRTIPLPEGTNSESATASFRDGVLEIEVDMPRQQQRGRTLEIREGSSGTGTQGGTYSGTGSGATYGSGTSGSQHLQGSTSGSQQAAQSGTTGAQHSQPGSSGSQQSSGTGTMYSGSGDPAAGAAGIAGGSSDTTKRGSR